MSVITTVSEAVARPARTAAQLAASAVIVEFVDSFFYTFTGKQYAALLALFALVLGYVQVLVENKKGKAFLRDLPATDVPVAVVIEGGTP